MTGDWLVGLGFFVEKFRVVFPGFLSNEKWRGILGAATESMASHTGEMIGGPKMCGRNSSGALVSPKKRDGAFIFGA